ncbi:MAG TPA: NifU family protein [Phycisphaerae bacterium]|jgi:Fe-S cluster biogenesis protein NfuA|nr:NifU family protein [Phycisphaerae bacterium]
MAVAPVPPASPADPPTVKERVEKVINWLRPIIQSDGGDLELVNVSEDGVVQVRFHGACVGCPSSNVTLRQGIERNIRDKVPEVREVVPVGE